MILVTGGAGYVGSHYVLHERARGTEVLVVDSLARGHAKAVLDAPLLVGDLADRAFLAEVFRSHAIDAVVHFAAYAYVGESTTAPGLYYGNNVGGTLALLEAMREHRVPAIVFSSTCATYGLPRYTPMDEDHPQAPVNPYGDSKLTCERMLAAFEQAHGLRSVALRYFNAAGADPEGRIGERHDPETHLIPLALDVAAGRRPWLTVFGTDYETADGTCVRDYVHVSDLASAHALALDWLRDGGASLRLNMGSGTGYSVREVAGACERLTGRPIPLRPGPRRAGDPPCLVASSRRAERALGWKPQHSGLEPVIASAWRWHQAPRF